MELVVDPNSKCKPHGDSILLNSTCSTQLSQHDQVEKIYQTLELIKTNPADIDILQLQQLAHEYTNSIAANLLGDLFFCGIGTEQDFYKAEKYYELAASLGNASGANNLGYVYQYGLKENSKFNPKPHEAMVHYVSALKIVAEHNHQNTDILDLVLQSLRAEKNFAISISQNSYERYGETYSMTSHEIFLDAAGHYRLEKDFLNAFAIYKNACLLEGRKVDSHDTLLVEIQADILKSANDDLKNKNYLNAYKKLFFLAKEPVVTAENQASALRLLGKMYCKGWGVNQDIKQAINYLNLSISILNPSDPNLSKLAQESITKACLLLGAIYSDEKSVHCDLKSAWYWYERAGEAGIKGLDRLRMLITNQCLLLGKIYSDENCAVFDFKLARSSYERAGDAGKKELERLALLAKDRLIMHLKNPEDERYKSAIDDFILSVGNAGDAYFQIGEMYQYGLEGISKDDLTAKIMYNKAINANQNSDANIALGDMFRTDGEYEHAMICYSRVDKNDLLAKGKIATLKLQVYSDALQDLNSEKTRDTGISKLTFLASKGYPEAQYKLGELYLESAMKLDTALTSEKTRFLKLAYGYSMSAKENNYLPACYVAARALWDLSTTLFDAFKNDAKIRELFELAAKSTDPTVHHNGKASYHYALFLSKSKEDKDTLKLVEYLSNAYKQGHSDALDQMVSISDELKRRYDDSMWPLKDDVALEVSVGLFDFAFAKNGSKACERRESERNQYKLTEQQREKELKEKELMEKERKEKELKEKERKEMIDSLTNGMSKIRTNGAFNQPKVKGYDAHDEDQYL